MFRLLMLLCGSLYCAMIIFGNGPSRTERYAVAAVSSSAPAPARDGPAPASRGIVILTAAGPAPTVAAEMIPLANLRQKPPGLAAPVVRNDVVPVAVLPDEVLPDGALPIDALPANTQLRWVTAGTANVRAKPNKRSALAGKVRQGEPVIVLWSEPNGWLRIRTDGIASGVSGFVHKSLLTDTPPETLPIELATAD